MAGRAIDVSMTHEPHYKEENTMTGCNCGCDWCQAGKHTWCLFNCSKSDGGPPSVNVAHKGE